MQLLRRSSPVPMERQVGKLLRDGRVRMKGGMNVRMEGFEVHDCGCLEYRRVEYGCLEGGCKLVSEHWSKIVRVDSCITPFPLFRVDVPSSSQRVWFGFFQVFRGGNCSWRGIIYVVLYG